MRKQINFLILCLFLSVSYGQQIMTPIGTYASLELSGTVLDIDEPESTLDAVKDSDYISSNNGVEGYAIFNLKDAFDPKTGTGHIVKYRMAKADNNSAPSLTGNSQDITVLLWENGVELLTVGSYTNVTTFQTYSVTLSEAQANSITDYSNLQIRFSFPNSGGGNPSNRRGGAVSWAEMEVPIVRRIMSINK